MLIQACKFVVAAGICCALSFNLEAQTKQDQSTLRFQHYNTKDGLADDLAVAIRTDSLGYGWTIHSGGLSRFDGYNFKVFQYDEHDPARSALNFNIGRILTDATGNIWITEPLFSESPQLIMVKYDAKADRFVKYKINRKGSANAIGFRFENDNSRVWAGRGLGNGMFSFDFKSGETEEFMNPDSDPTRMKLQSTINAIRDFNTHLLIGTARGLWLFDKKEKKFSRPPCSPSDSTLMYESRIVWFATLKNQKDKKSFWFRTGGSLIEIDSNFSIVNRTEKMNPTISTFDTDDESFWFNRSNIPESGLFRLSVRDDSLINILAAPGERHSLQSNEINEITVDRDLTVWLGTQQGMSRLVKNSLHYQNVNLTNFGANVLYRAGEQEFLIVNQDKKFLIAPIGPGIDAKMKFKEILSPAEGGFVSGMWKGRKYFWISVTNEGGGVLGYPINPETDLVDASPFIYLRHDPNNKNTIAANRSNAVWESPDGYLWVVNTTMGLSQVNIQVPYGSEGSVIRYLSNPNDSNSLISNRTWSFLPEDDQSVWVLTWGGVDLVHFNEKPVRFEHVFSNREVPIVLFRTSAGQVYLGTRNGLYVAIKERGKYRFSFQSIAGNRSITAIQEDKLGRLWLKSNKTLLCLDLGQKTVVEFNDRDGIDHLRSLEHRAPHHGIHRTKDGSLMVVDPDGITLFDPQSFQIDRKPIRPVLTNLLVNNRPPRIGGNQDETENYTIPSQINFLSELVIDYRHNNFAIEFSAMEMTAPEKNLYRHKLEGFDKDWIESDFKNRIASYTNLDPGTYFFKVKSSNHHGVWSDLETVLPVRILPPPWLTWWAYSLYGAAFMCLLLTWRSYENKRLKLKHRAEHLTEIDTLKTQFFTNISHEFRTPLTLILGPLKDLYNTANSVHQRKVMGTMMRNGERLLKLINQLLDISKLEAGKMVLHASPKDIVQLIRDIASSYESLALNNNIKFTVYPEVHELVACVDQEKIEKILHNILSNAFKFTPEGGEVIVHSKVLENKWFQIAVKDTGIGIPVDKLDNVFNRFYQVDNSQTRQFEGSGLGMALARELVELHHGKISVVSTEGKGTTFAVLLPIGKEHYSEMELVDLAGIRQNGLEYFEPSVTRSKDEIEEHEMSLNGDRPVLLIVEDNIDMRHYIQRILSDGYHIDVAADGKEGISKAEQVVPDLIISDVMMPEMDGYELCKRVKSNELTSHIPVILLTAKADRESKLDGLETGADDYLSKPFDVEELKLIVRNRINEIRRLRDRFSKEITLEPRKIAITSLDEKFLTKVLGIIEEHMHEEAFSLDDLSREVGYSSMHLYRKIKALSGQTPGVFLKTIRLKRAAELLAKNSDNVNQVAYSVGFSSPSYFNKCFKEQFGVTPGQYAESILKN